MSLTPRSRPTTAKRRTARKSNAYQGKETKGVFRRLLAFAGFWFRVGMGCVFVACISIGILFVYRYMTVQPFFSLKHIVISGNSHCDDAGLIAESRVRTGQSIFETDIEDVQRNLQDNPWIAKVSVRRVLPDQIEIHVQEKQACFWIKKDKILYYADRLGQPIDKVRPEKFISLPVLSLSSAGTLQEKILEQTVELVDGKSLPFGFASISSLALSGNDAMEIQLEPLSVLVVIGLGSFKENCRRLALTWDDLRRRDELRHSHKLQAFGGKVWVTSGS